MTFRLLLVYLALVATFFLVRAFHPGMPEAPELSHLQLAFVPLVAMVLGLFRFGKVRIPRLLLILAVAASATGFVARRIYRSDPSTAFIVARLGGDPLENRSRIYRKRIETALVSFPDVTVLGYPNEIQSLKEAESLLRRMEELPGIVWGTERWLTISFPRERLTRLNQLAALKPLPAVGALKLVNSIPAIGLGFSPQGATTHYIAALFRGLVHLRAAAHTPVAEVDLREAGLVVSNWSSVAHRAYPWWKLGNLYLTQALSKPDHEPGSLRCAIEAYRIAVKFVRRGENSDLFAAIRNNLAISLIVDGAMNGVGAKREAKRLLKSATNVIHDPNPFRVKLRSPTVAKRNLSILRGVTLGRSGGKGRASKKKGSKRKRKS